MTLSVIATRLIVNARSAAWSLDDREAGQGLAEYALILGLIAMIAIVALLFMGSSIKGLLSKVGASV